MSNRRLRGLGGLIALFCISCQAVGSDPEAVVQKFIAAANTGQNHEVYKLLGPRSQQRLAELRQSAKRVSGRLALQPEDFLAVGRSPPAWEVAGVRLLRQSQTEASVQVFSTAGDRHALTLVKVGGEWKVELPGG